MKFTRQYPEEKWIPPASYRETALVQEDDGTKRCVALRRFAQGYVLLLL
ncbi:MAG: hypothetical protein R2942_12965 [Ignavibacteria bacterium]